LRETTTELERIEEKEEIKEMYTESVLREDVKNNNA
jgi:ribosomal protein L1